MQQCDLRVPHLIISCQQRRVPLLHRRHAPKTGDDEMRALLLPQGRVLSLCETLALLMMPLHSKSPITYLLLFNACSFLLLTTTNARFLSFSFLHNARSTIQSLIAIVLLLTTVERCFTQHVSLLLRLHSSCSCCGNDRIAYRSAARPITSTER